MSGAVPARSLVVPDLLQGHWSSALLMTYGADLGFFESRLAGQLAQVPLRIVLGDGRRHREKLTEAATTGQRLRMANRSYLASPIHHRRAAHAKTILLLGPREGVLVVGSGNLNHDGYASPGELWHVYRYHDDDPTHLDEFAAVRSLIDGIANRGLLDPPTTEVLGTLWGTAPWLPGTPTGPRTVHHNLDQPLIDQLASAAGWPVRELVVHAPFHDPRCLALEALIDRFKPQRLRVLVSRATSVHTARLDAVMAAAPKSTLEVIEVAADPATYIHAKWVHLKGDDTEALLTGSANLSQSALLRSAGGGNIEAGVISVAGKGGFASLYDHFLITKASDAGSLGLAYSSGDNGIETNAYPIVLWTRLDANRLTIMFDRPIADDLELHVDGINHALAWTTMRIDGSSVVLTLDEASAAIAGEGGALAIDSGTGRDAEPSYSWPYQLAAILGRLNKAGSRDQLHRIGSLPDRDADLYALLQELENTLIFDPISTWRVVRPDAPTPTGEDGVSMEWSGLDWTRVRRDPRFTGYFASNRSLGAAPTDIQVILAAIAGRLGDLGIDSISGAATAQDDESELAAEGAQEDSENVEDRENELDDEVLRRSLAVSTRTRMAFNRFIKRYTAAVRDAGFVEELGPIVTAKNAVIFSHLLSRLIERGAVDPERAVEAQVAIWRVLWGSGDTSGLLTSLQDDERPHVERIVTEATIREATIRAIAKTSNLELSTEVRRAVRDQFRHLIVDKAFKFNSDLIVAAEAQGELATLLLEGLTDVAVAADRGELIDFVLEPLGVTSTGAEWRTRGVQRLVNGKPTPFRANVLEVQKPVAGLSNETAHRALERVAVACHLGDLDGWYLRIRFVGNGSAVAYWDWQTESGVVMVDGEVRDIESLDPPWPDWLSRLESTGHVFGVFEESGVA